MKNTPLFLKYNTHSIASKSDSALLSKKNLVFYKEIISKLTKNTFSQVSNYFFYTYKKTVLFYQHYILLCIVCIYEYVYYTYKTTQLKSRGVLYEI